MATIKLWGFNGSTYVRTVRMLLHEKGVADYEQVPVNVQKGEPRQPEHLARHPFGKVPVVDHGGHRLLETGAICTYLDAVLPGPQLIPADPWDRARVDMTVAVIDSYGYPSLLAVMAYHLFPDLVGGKNQKAHDEGLATGRKTLETIMGWRGDSAFIAGERQSVADFFLAPIMAYLAMTPHMEELLDVPGMRDWWNRASQLESFRATPPN